MEGKSGANVEWATGSDGWADLKSNYSLAGNYEGVFEGNGPSSEDGGQEREIEEDSEDTIEIEDTEETEPAIAENQEQESEEKESEEISEEQERQNED